MLKALPSDTSRIFHYCARCHSTGVCAAPACEAFGGSCYLDLPGSAALLLGAADRRDGYARESCPFPDGHDRRAAWLRGWYAHDLDLQERTP